MSSPSRQRVLEPPQHHERGARAEDGALAVVVEGGAAAVRRQDLAVLEAVAAPVRQIDRHAPGDSHVAFHGEQRADRLVHRHEPGRAGGLHRHRRALQVQQVGEPRRHEILVVAGVAQQEEADLLDELGVGEQVVGQVRLHARPGEDADAPLETLGHVPGVLQRLPGDLEEMPVLGVEDGGVARREAEEAGVEALHVLEEVAGLHVVRVGDLRPGRALGQQLLVRHPAGAGALGLEQAPEGVDRARAGEAAGHADDGDPVGAVEIVRLVHELSVPCPAYSTCSVRPATGRA